MKTQLFVNILLLFLISCSGPVEKTQSEQTGKELTSYSDRLSIQAFSDYTQITVKHSKNEASDFTYILYQKGTKKPEMEADAFISTPVTDIICFSTSHLPALDVLGLEDHLIGFPDTKWIYDSSMREKVSRGLIHDIGQKGGINIEKALSLNPDVVMGYSTGNAYDNLKPLQQAGIPVVINVDYLEANPLGRAEWIKFTAAFFNKIEEADSIFDAIEKSYKKLQEIGQSTKSKPSVMTGVMYGDTWYVPGGDSFGAKFIEDAGGDYLWAENDETGSLELSYEVVLNKAQTAQYWIGVANVTSYEELKNTDTRYTYFEAFKERNIYGYTKRMREEGGNDYLESGYLRPDLVLKDHINILHPETLKEEELIFFQPLKK